jgi:hypothetical protein
VAEHWLYAHAVVAPTKQTIIGLAVAHLVFPLLKFWLLLAVVVQVPLSAVVVVRVDTE